MGNFNNSTSLANASASLVDVQNAGSTKFRVLASGNLTTNGTAAVSGSCTSRNVTVTNGLITAVMDPAFTPIANQADRGSGTATKSSGATIVCAQVVGGGGGGAAGRSGRRTNRRADRAAGAAATSAEVLQVVLISATPSYTPSAPAAPAALR